jgi:hypothetical protein
MFLDAPLVGVGGFETLSECFASRLADVGFEVVSCSFGRLTRAGLGRICAGVRPRVANTICSIYTCIFRCPDRSDVPVVILLHVRSNLDAKP